MKPVINGPHIGDNEMEQIFHLKPVLSRHLKIFYSGYLLYCNKTMQS